VLFENFKILLFLFVCLVYAIFSGIVYILKVFRMATLEMQSECLPTLSMVAPTLKVINLHLRSQPHEKNVDIGYDAPFSTWEEFPVECQDFRTKLLESFNTRMWKLATPCAFVATLLDSRFKNHALTWSNREEVLYPLFSDVLLFMFMFRDYCFYLSSI
jgi:hypothetical protein